MRAQPKLEDVFTRFPGVGPKQAKRFVYFLLRQNSSFKNELIALLEDIRHSGRQCGLCYTYYGDADINEKLCNICRSERNHAQLLVVEKELDIEAIEKTNAYNGYYFVLGGLLSGKRDEKPSETIRIRELVARTHALLEEKLLCEIIYALPVTMYGDNTEEYLEKTLAQVVGIATVKRSHLARGLSTGLEIEYVDSETFRSSFERRG